MPFASRFIRPLSLLALAAVLTSCTAKQVLPPTSVHLALNGRVMGGQQPITGSVIHLYQVGTQGMGSLATDLLISPVTSSDGTGSGGDASNDTNHMPPGNFTLTGDYPCPATDDLVYLAAVGGNPGAGENDSQVNLVALGHCANLSASTFIDVNEVTTVGTMAALAPFVDYNFHQNGYYQTIGSDPGDPALATAFNKAAMYIDSASGSAPGSALPAGFDASSNDLRALANVLQTCVNSVSSPSSPSTACSNLFNIPANNNLPNDYNYAPMDTVDALVGIFYDPGNSVTQLFNMQSPTQPFTPTNASAPADWSLPILQIPGTPSFSPATGTYNSTQTFTITDSDPTATIHYTIDGGTPTASSNTYTGAFYLTGSATVKAIAIESGRLTSSIGSVSYGVTIINAAAPTFSPVSGSYTSAQTVTLSSTTPQAVYYYTTDGTTPTTASTIYSAPFTVGVTETIKAIAIATGYGPSAVSSASYTITSFTPNIISTVAGTGARNYYGDGVYATAAQLSVPSTVMLDPSGNLIIADGNPAIRKVDVNSGIITTIVGDGVTGAASGDGGLAINATGGAASMFYDAAGNLYLGTNTVRKIDASTGKINTLVGGGGAGGSISGIVPTGTTGNGDGGPALSPNVRFQTIGGLLVDSSGNMYLADTNNMRIRMVYEGGAAATAFLARQRITNPVVGYIYTICGDLARTFQYSSSNPYATSYTGDGGLAVDADVYSPSGMAFDPSGNIVFADAGNSRIRKIDLTSGVISTVAGGTYPASNKPLDAAGYAGDGGSATDGSVMFNQPVSVSYDTGGNLYISDYGNNMVRKVTAGTGILSTVAGEVPYHRQGFVGDGGPATSAMMYNPFSAVMAPNGVLYIADTRNNRIRKVDATGTITTFAGSGVGTYMAGLGGNALQAQIYYPEGVAVASNGNMYITNSPYNEILKLDASTGYLTLFAGVSSGGTTGNGAATSVALNSPRGVAVDGSGNVYIADTQGHVIRKVDSSGNSTIVAGTAGTPGSTGNGGLATSALLWSPYAVSVDASGNLFIADTSNSCIREVLASNHNIQTAAGNCALVTNGISFGGDGASATASTAKFFTPRGVTVSANDDIYITDTQNARVRLVYNGGAAAATLLVAQGQTPVVGNLYTIAGNGSYGSTGDGSLANAAMIGYPVGITLDASGNVFFATQNLAVYANGNERIRRIDATTGRITTYVNSTGIGDNNTAILTNAQIGDGGSASNAMLTNPSGVAFDAAGNLYIGDSIERRVRKVAH